MDISLGATALSTAEVSVLRGGLHDMMAVSRSTQFDGLFEGIHFRFIQFLYLYVHIPGSSCCKVGFGQYHMIFIESDVDDTFFRSATFPRNNGMSASLSSLLVFIATIWPTFTSINGSNFGNTSSRSVSVAMLASVVEGLGFFATLDAVVCGFLHRGPKNPLGDIGQR